MREPLEAARLDAERARSELADERRRIRDFLLNAPAVIAITRGPRHVIELANDRFLALFGQTDPAQVIGRPAAEAFPKLGPVGYLDLADQVYATGEPFVINAMPGRIDRDGDGVADAHWSSVVIFPMRDAEGNVDGLMLHATDVTDHVLARQRAEEATERIRRLQAITAYFAQVRTTQDLANSVVEQVIKAVGAQFGALGKLVDQGTSIDTMEMIGVGGYLRDPRVVAELRRWQRFSIARTGTFEDIIHSAQPIFFRSRAERLARYPQLDRTQQILGLDASAALPLVSAGRVIGILWLGFAGTHDFDQDEREFLLALARQCAQALERANLFARLEREEVHQRLLAQASRMFAEAQLDQPLILDELCRCVVDGIGDVAAVQILAEDGRSLRVAAIYDPDSQRQEYARAVLSAQPLEIGEGLSGQVLQTGEPILIPRVDSEAYRRRGESSHQPYLDDRFAQSIIVVPLRAHGRVLGTLIAVRTRPDHPYVERDQQLLQELADRAALAIENVHLYAEEQIAHRLAERAADRIARLQAVTAALSRAQTPVQVAEAVIVEAIAALEAQAGAVLELSGDGTQFHILTQTGYATDTSEAAAVLQEWPRVSLREATPAGDAVRSGDVVILESAVDRAARYPYLRSVTEVMGGGASVAIPLLLNGKPIGVMHLLFATARRFDADDRALLLTIGRQCAQALERARLYQQAQDALRVRDEFLSIAAHELKTPVAALRLLAQASLRRLERFSSLEPDRLTRIFRDIDQQSHRLARLVNQLLDISRLELGRVQIQCYPTELKGLIEGIIDSLRSREGGERIVMTRGETLIVNLDPLRIEQVITNLLDNALKYSRASGLIEVNVAREGQEAIVSVTDHGPGIPPERRDRIFERFYQAHQDSNLSGLGLGLYISRQLVELHRGSLEAEFPPEGGTRFIVRLPIVPIQAAT